MSYLIIKLYTLPDISNHEQIGWLYSPYWSLWCGEDRAFSNVAKCRVQHDTWNYHCSIYFIGFWFHSSIFYFAKVVLQMISSSFYKLKFFSIWQILCCSSFISKCCQDANDSQISFGYRSFQLWSSFADIMTNVYHLHLDSFKRLAVSRSSTWILHWNSSVSLTWNSVTA